MWDFHSHILPNIDDGAKDSNETIKMAKIAVQEGIHTMVATPHYIPFDHEVHKDEILESIKKINEALKRENIPIKILPGMEVFADWEILKRIDQGQILTINDTRYILIELPMHNIPDDIDDLFFEIEVRGLLPILAHPERNRKIQNNQNIVAKWIEKGVLTQINTGSLMGILGQASQETAGILLKHNMVHLLGTDAHTSGRRSPEIKEAINTIKEILTLEQCKLILEEYPKQILANEIVTPGKPVLVRKKKRFFFF
ncbi:protein tyrosine phosphatase [Irregularibacter muris]|uniref:protein-tyrosine-phosphatase n=1 Tax=Irregularibacter muris TaxID=1796619 RepID=A0AAE3HIC8_9FIRM|nr:CpsB/CapC family capsule biosynthesis tyrosine phosphatase [Irregularibacter muris]MCR1900067.1 protein tyrosine phosphatase [Irregularibacter muris]